MRATLVAIIILCLTFMVFIPQSPAEDAQYKSPWVETDKSLYKLVNNDYKIVGTSMNVNFMTESAFEFIYLKKGNKIFRCATLESKTKTVHTCEALSKPEKAK